MGSEVVSFNCFIYLPLISVNNRCKINPSVTFHLQLHLTLCSRILIFTVPQAKCTVNRMHCCWNQFPYSKTTSQICTTCTVIHTVQLSAVQYTVLGKDEIHIQEWKTIATGHMSVTKQEIVTQTCLYIPSPIFHWQDYKTYTVYISFNFSELWTAIYLYNTEILMSHKFHFFFHVVRERERENTISNLLMYSKSLCR